MALPKWENFAKVTVSTGYNDTATSIDLLAGDGAELPSTGDFYLSWWNDTDYKDPADDPLKEIVKCTARSTDTLTIVRGQRGTSAQNHNTAGKTYKMVISINKEDMDEIKNAIENVVYKETPSGTINGVNTSFTIANTPSPANNEVLTVNGQVMTPTEDYTISGTTLTFVNAPLTGSIIRITYRY